MTVNHKWNEGYEAPNDIHKIVSNIFEGAILNYLIQLDNGYNAVYASYETLRLGYMSKPKVNESIKGLEIKGFITIIRHNYPQSNEYRVNIDDIKCALMAIKSTDELNKGARREYSEQQKFAMTVRNAQKYPDAAHKAENLMGNTVVNDDGEILGGK